jgi:hypothetical protein
MPSFRLTVRHGAPQRYHVVDIDAADLHDAVRRAAQHVPAGADARADLVEIRLQADPTQREYTPER